MSRVRLYRWLVVVGAVALLEALCLAGAIDRITMQPPHQIARDFVRIIGSGKLNAAIAKTLGNAAIAFMLAVAAGGFAGVVIHPRPRRRPARDPRFATY
jgi:NitT/TauT family transport system permease protein